MKLKTAYKDLKQREPKLRIRDAAKKLGVSEAQLVALSESNVRLRPEFEQLLNEIPKLGYVMALTRNEDAVHERKGIYTKASFTGKIGLVTNPDIDLRLFLFSWHSVFAVQEGERKSIQFFAKDGSAIHKIYLTNESNNAVYDELIDQYAMAVEEPLLIDATASVDGEKLSNDLDVTAFQEEWLALEDTHNFFALLKKYGVERTRALEIAPKGYTKSIRVADLKAILHDVAGSELEIMVFIGNKGCIQIHTGRIHRLVQAGTWFNVLDPEFNMHLREEGIASIWIVKKPTSDGIVTSIEVFDPRGDLIVQFFGKRKPGIPELQEWRDVLAKIEDAIE